MRRDKTKKDESKEVPKKEVPEEDLFVIIDSESNALEYGPSPDKDAALAHANKLRALDQRGELSATVGRELHVYKLNLVKSKDAKTADVLRVPTDSVDRWDRTSAKNAGDPGVAPVFDPTSSTPEPPKDK